MEQSQPSLYKYRPLQHPDHIRVIVLCSSADDSAPIRFSFQEDRLTSLEGQYEAISYTWGEPNLVYPLYLSDDTSHVKVTENLDRALRRLRYQGRQRYLWADAVCINQADNAQKATQIPLMARIFQGASTVLAYLGPGGEEEMGLRVLARWSRRRREHPWDTSRHTDPHKDMSSGSGQDQRQLASLNQPRQGLSPGHTITEQDLLHVILFLKLSWFTRLWIIQEVVFNLDINLIYGSAELSWLRLVNGLLALRKTLYDRQNPVERKISDAILGVADLWTHHCGLDAKEDLGVGIGHISIESAGPSGLGMLRLLHLFQGFNCTDGRDRIYALYSLAIDMRPTGQEAFNPRWIVMDIDYSLDLQQTYQVFATASIQAYLNVSQTSDGWSNIAILLSTIARQYNPAPRHWPSWLPDWQTSPEDLEEEVRFLKKTGRMYIQDPSPTEGRPGSINEKPLLNNAVTVSLTCTWWSVPWAKSKELVPVFTLLDDRPAPRDPSNHLDPLQALQWNAFPIIDAIHDIDPSIQTILTLYKSVCPVHDITEPALHVALTHLLKITSRISNETISSNLNDCWSSPDASGDEAFTSHLNHTLSRNCFFTATMQSMMFFGLGNRALATGDQLISFYVSHDDDVFSFVLPSDGYERHWALIVRPVGRGGVASGGEGAEEDGEEEQVYKLVGTARLLGPVVEGRVLEGKRVKRGKRFRDDWVNLRFV